MKVLILVLGTRGDIKPQLEPRLLDLIGNGKYRLNTGLIAEKMKKEDFSGELDELII